MERISGAAVWEHETIKRLYWERDSGKSVPEENLESRVCVRWRWRKR